MTPRGRRLMTRPSWRLLLLGTLLLMLTGGSTPRAEAQASVLPAAVSAGLAVHGIPIPQGARPYLAANLSLKNLQSVAPAAGELGSGWVRAVVYDIPPPAPPDQVAAYYRDSMPGSALLPRQLPERRRPPVTEDGTRVLLLMQHPARYLAIRAQDGTGQARITVAMYEGTAAADVVLNAMGVLSENGAGPRDPTALLSPSKEQWETDSRFMGEGLRILKSHLSPGGAPDPVLGVMRTLIDQAQSLRLRQYRVPRTVNASEALHACMQEARANRWRLWSVEAETERNVSALYRMQDDRGMVWLRTGQGQPTSVPPRSGNLADTTEISRLEVTGTINLWQLLRPSQSRPPVLSSPSLTPSTGRGGLGAPPRSPFSAQPRR
jgi:hypothetical protein